MKGRGEKKRKKEKKRSLFLAMADSFRWRFFIYFMRSWTKKKETHSSDPNDDYRHLKVFSRISLKKKYMTILLSNIPLIFHCQIYFITWGVNKSINLLKFLRPFSLEVMFIWEISVTGENKRERGRIECSLFEFRDYLIIMFCS